MRVQAPPGFVLVREAVQQRHLEPGTFLRWGRGRSRGFWARRRGWLAHVGELDSLVHSERGKGDRFLQILRRAAQIAGREDGNGWRREGRGAESAPRFYGGFSFRDDHVPRDFWAGFPRARFVLPELELEHDGDVACLTAQALAVPREDVRRVRSRLRALLDSTLDALARAGRSSGGTMSRPAARLRSGRRGWQRAIEEILTAIRGGRVEKAVLARILDVSTTGALDPVEVLEYLRRENGDAHVFLFEPTPGSLIVGATPEALASVRGDRFRATAVAGSVSRGETGEEQRALARQLLTSAKDRVEHAFTVRDMVARLGPLSRTVEAEAEPHVLTLARIQHLETRIKAVLRPGTSVLDVVAALHPTPAVCGLPRDAALELLSRNEPFERGWYAGPVGWFDTRGDGVFVPALRTAVARSTTWRLFAGAGIVPGSNPESEWEETGIKFEPVLRALDGAGARGIH
jgi:menaquinone-specific isochorismate synthase